MKPEFCSWCSAPIKVQDTYDPMRMPAVCSVGCKDAEKLFQAKFCDEAHNRREHYRVLTKGEPDGQG